VSKLAEQEMPQLDPSLRGAGTFMLLVISNNLLALVHKSKGNWFSVFSLIIASTYVIVKRKITFK